MNLPLVKSYKNNIVYVYTPCINSELCTNNNIAVMAYLVDSETFKCEQYLAIWENGIVEPSYDEKNKI